MGYPNDRRMPEYQYSQNQLAHLAACAKRVTEAPRREMKARAHIGAMILNWNRPTGSINSRRSSARIRLSQRTSLSVWTIYQVPVAASPSSESTALMETVTAASILRIPTLVRTFTE